MKPEDEDDEGRLKKGARKATGDALTTATGAVIGAIAGPEAAVAGAVAMPYVRGALRLALESLNEKRRTRGARLIELAAEEAGIDIETLLEKLQDDPNREEILQRTLRVAMESSMEGKLFALSKALASTAIARTPRVVQWEAMFVRTLDDLDEGHIDLLDRFLWSANKLGLGGGQPEFEEPVNGLNRAQLDLVMPDLKDMVDSMVAVVERHGLIARTERGGGSFGGGGGGPTHWVITTFGREFLARLRLVSNPSA